MIQTDITVNVFNFVKFLIIPCVATPILEWLVAKAGSSLRSRTLRKGEVLRLRQSRLGPWSLHAESGGRGARSVLTSALITATYLGISLSLEYGFGATQQPVYEAGRALRMGGGTEPNMKYGFRYSLEDVYLSQFLCAGRALAADREQACSDIEEPMIRLTNFATERFDLTDDSEVEAERVDFLGLVKADIMETSTSLRQGADLSCVHFANRENICIRSGGNSLMLGMGLEGDDSLFKVPFVYRICDVEEGSIDNARVAVALALRMVVGSFPDRSVAEISLTEVRRALKQVNLAGLSRVVVLLDEDGDVSVPARINVGTRSVAVIERQAVISCCVVLVIVVSLLLIVCCVGDMDVTLEAMYRRKCMEEINSKYNCLQVPKEAPQTGLQIHGDGDKKILHLSATYAEQPYGRAERGLILGQDSDILSQPNHRCSTSV